jgi:hypothetical protein
MPLSALYGAKTRRPDAHVGLQTQKIQPASKVHEARNRSENPSVLFAPRFGSTCNY